MKKYDLYMVKVVMDDKEAFVKTHRNTTSYSEMKELYDITKEKITDGNVLLIGINSTGYTTLHSKYTTKEEEIDLVVSSLIKNIKWLIEYNNKSQELFGSMNMSRDMFLKNVELFDFYEKDNELENLKLKENIFDKLKEILVLRRKVKYSNILVNKISSRLNLNRILTVLEKSIEAASENSSVNISPSAIEKQSEHDIEDFFSLETINKLSEIRNQNDKILVTENKVIGYRKVTQDVNVKIASETAILEENKEFSIPGDIIYKCNDLEIEDTSSISCISKVSFTNIQQHHIDDFIKNKSKKFNLMTREDDAVHCYILKESSNTLV